MGRVELRNLSKTFPPNIRAVEEVNLTIEEGEFVTLLGPSGCGKTTTLRLIAGFEDPTTGQILIDVHRRYLGAQMRDVNQEVALYRAGSAGTSSAFLVAQLADSLTTPSQFAVREEMVLEMRAALETLDPIDREVLVLRHLEELSNNEVAEILGIDKYAASKRYLRALARLRAAMPVYE